MSANQNTTFRTAKIEKMLVKQIEFDKHFFYLRI